MKMHGYSHIVGGMWTCSSSPNVFLCRFGRALRLARTAWATHHLPSRFIASTASYEGPKGGQIICNYFREKALSTLHFVDIPQSREDLHISIYDSLAALASDLSLDLDLLDLRLSNKDAAIEDWVMSPPRYPKVSFLPDGHINLSLIKLGHYNDFISEARRFRAEEVASSVRLYPARRNRGRIKDAYKVEQLQRHLDLYMSNVIADSTTSDLARILRFMYQLDISIRATRLSDVSKKFMRGINSMSFSQLVEIAFLLRAYMGATNESCSLVLSAIGNRLERNWESHMRTSADDVMEQLIPIVQMQIYYPCMIWTLLGNASLIHYLVSSAERLDIDGRAALFTVLTLANSTIPLFSTLSDTRRSLAAQLEGVVCDISDRTLDRLLTISDRFELEFPQFSNSLYHNALTRLKTLRPTLLASVYLKINMKNDVVKQFQHDIGRRFVEVARNVLVELYCHFLKEGSRSKRQLQHFEYAFLRKGSTLSMRDMSTILMHQSIHGNAPSRLNDIIRTQFLELKRSGHVKHDELMDLVLSMSLVGLHNGINVWSGVDLPHLVYSTPQNILVYLGYILLMTGERSRGIWRTLLERMLYESKTLTAEVYEVLKVSQVFGILGENMNEQLLRRASWILQHTKSQHYTKMSRPRYKSLAPIGRALDLIGLQYSKGVIIEDLYEAPYFIKSHKIILDPLRASYLHPTTGLEVGETHLRHSVWRKQGYYPFPLNAQALRKFQVVESGEWNVSGLADFICSVIKMHKRSALKGNKRLGILQTKQYEQNHGVLNRRNELQHSNYQGNISRLQKLLLDRPRRI